MAVGPGIALIVVGSLTGALVQLAMWRRLATAPALALLGLSGAAVGAGALLVQDRAGPGSWVVTLVVLGGLVPIHARLVRGRPGTSR